MVPEALAAGVVGGGLVLGARAMFDPRSALFGPVTWHGPRAAPVVALTFDDGPWPGASDAILDVLQRERIPATFFVIGRYAAQHPGLVARMHAEGHLVANHSFDHDRLGMFRWQKYWADQIDRTGDVLEPLLGSRPTLFRPPMGFKSPHLSQAARKAGCRVVTWSRRAHDGVATTPERIVRHLAAACAGDILLLHDGRDPASRRTLSATAAALPRVIEAIRRSGLAFERLDRLLAKPAGPI